MKKVVIPILFMLGCAISEGYAQKVALKSNLLYDATTTMNLGLDWRSDWRVNGRWIFRSIIIRGNFPTANASVIGGYNPKFVTGFVRVFAVCLSECTDIMPISM